MVEEGSFTIYDDDENELARVGKGSCFGELALLRQVRPAISSFNSMLCSALNAGLATRNPDV